MFVIINLKIIKIEGEFLKKLFEVSKKYLCMFFMFVALIIPEVMFRKFIEPGVFDERYISVASSFFAVGWATFVAVLWMLVLPQRTGEVVFLIVSLCFFVFSLSECVYYKIFEQFFWIKSICLAGEGSDYFGYAFELIEPWMIKYFVIALLSVIMAFVTWSSPKKSRKIRITLLIIPFAILFATHVCMQPELHNDSADEWDVWRKPRIVYKNFNDVNKSIEIAGIYQFMYLDLYNCLFSKEYNITNDDKYVADEYFTLKGKAEKNKFSGLLKGKNVIAVIMESMDTWMIDENTTPTLHKMMNSGISFINYNAPFFGAGFTLSSEFAFNTGFFTPVSAGSASNFSQNTFPYSVARLFKDSGYTTKSFHFNSSEFYNRGIMHKTYGYEKYYEAADFGITGFEAELDSNLIKNDDFYNKMVEISQEFR